MTNNSMKNMEFLPCVFLLGRPGCGKSAIFKLIEERILSQHSEIELERIDDFPKLWNIFQTDTEHKRHRPTKDGGFKVTDDSVWDDLLREVNMDVRNSLQKNKLLFVEFSRSDYIRAISNFDEDLIKNSILIYIDCPFEICWERNVARFEKARAEGHDNHLVSREEMEKTYLTDDKDRFTQKYDVIVIRNDYDSIDPIIPEIDKIFGILGEKIIQL